MLVDAPAEPDDLSRSIYVVFFGGVLILQRLVVATAKAEDNLQTCDYQECIIWNSDLEGVKDTVHAHMLLYK